LDVGHAFNDLGELDLSGGHVVAGHPYLVGAVLNNGDDVLSAVISAVRREKSFAAVRVMFLGVVGLVVMNGFVGSGGGGVWPQGCFVVFVFL
jgi:hypothetical protein